MWTPDSKERTQMEATPSIPMSTEENYTTTAGRAEALAKATRIQDAYDLAWAERFSDMYAEQGMTNDDVHEAYEEWLEDNEYRHYEEQEYAEEIKEQSCYQQVTEEEAHVLIEQEFDDAEEMKQSMIMWDEHELLTRVEGLEAELQVIVGQLEGLTGYARKFKEADIKLATMYLAEAKEELAKFQEG